MIPPLPAGVRANIATMQREVTAVMAQAWMVDTCRRRTHTETRNSDGRRTGSTYVAGAPMPCAFSWGRDNDRTEETPEGRTISTPSVRVPTSAGFTGADQVEITHLDGVALVPTLVFAVQGQPQPETGYTRLELERTT